MIELLIVFFVFFDFSLGLKISSGVYGGGIIEELNFNVVNKGLGRGEDVVDFDFEISTQDLSTLFFKGKERIMVNLPVPDDKNPVGDFVLTKVEELSDSNTIAVYKGREIKTLKYKNGNEPLEVSLTYSVDMGLRIQYYSKAKGYMYLDPYDRFGDDQSVKKLYTSFKVKKHSFDCLNNNNNNSTNEDNSTEQITINKNEEANSLCPVNPVLIGNRECNPAANNVECGYDGGDCCRSYTFCEVGSSKEECACKDPDHGKVILHKYKLALAADGTYAEFYKGKKHRVIASMITHFTRVNEIYQRELGISFELVENWQNLLIEMNRNEGIINDGGTFQGDGDSIIRSFQRFLNIKLPETEYDIGHLLNGVGKGYGPGDLCNPTTKGGGYSGIGMHDFDVGFVEMIAHELGHQMGADHTFTYCERYGNYYKGTPLWGVEPASGTTIMSYAGVCGSTNLKTVQDSYFHSSSIEQIKAFISNPFKGGSCGVHSTLSQNNVTPSLNRATCTIPRLTAFRLQSEFSSDVTVLYNWEQGDILYEGFKSGEPQSTSLFRSVQPVANRPWREFPSIETHLLDPSFRLNNILGETLPNISRTMNFVMTKRERLNDENGIGHAFVSDEIRVLVDGADQPFRVNNITTPIELGTPFKVVWNGANRNANRVRILISYDGGYTFPKVLSHDTENDGEETVIVDSCRDEFFGQARIKIETIESEKCSFFTISENTFDIKGCAINNNDNKRIPQFSTWTTPYSQVQEIKEYRVADGEEITLENLYGEVLIVANNSNHHVVTHFVDVQSFNWEGDRIRIFDGAHPEFRRQIIDEEYGVKYTRGESFEMKSFCSESGSEMFLHLSDYVKVTLRAQTVENCKQISKFPTSSPTQMPTPRPSFQNTYTIDASVEGNMTFISTDGWRKEFKIELVVPPLENDNTIPYLTFVNGSSCDGDYNDYYLVRQPGGNTVELSTLRRNGLSTISFYPLKHGEGITVKVNFKWCDLHVHYGNLNVIESEESMFDENKFIQYKRIEAKTPDRSPFIFVSKVTKHEDVYSPSEKSFIDIFGCIDCQSDYTCWWEPCPETFYLESNSLYYGEKQGILEMKWRIKINKFSFIAYSGERVDPVILRANPTSQIVEELDYEENIFKEWKISSPYERVQVQIDDLNLGENDLFQIYDPIKPEEILFEHNNSNTNIGAAIESFSDSLIVRIISTKNGISDSTKKIKFSYVSLENTVLSQNDQQTTITVSETSQTWVIQSLDPQSSKPSITIENSNENIKWMVFDGSCNVDFQAQFQNVEKTYFTATTQTMCLMLENPSKITTSFSFEFYSSNAPTMAPTESTKDYHIEIPDAAENEIFLEWSDDNSTFGDFDVAYSGKKMHKNFRFTGARHPSLVFEFFEFDLAEGDEVILVDNWKADTEWIRLRNQEGLGRKFLSVPSSNHYYVHHVEFVTKTKPFGQNSHKGFHCRIRTRNLILKASDEIQHLNYSFYKEWKSPFLIFIQAPGSDAQVALQVNKAELRSGTIGFYDAAEQNQIADDYRLLGFVSKTNKRRYIFDPMISSTNSIIIKFNTFSSLTDFDFTFQVYKPPVFNDVDGGVISRAYDDGLYNIDLRIEVESPIPGHMPFIQFSELDRKWGDSRSGIYLFSGGCKDRVVWSQDYKERFIDTNSDVIARISNVGGVINKKYFSNRDKLCLLYRYYHGRDVYYDQIVFTAYYGFGNETNAPTPEPTFSPSQSPTSVPSLSPSTSPTVSSQPTISPTESPTMLENIIIGKNYGIIEQSVEEGNRFTKTWQIKMKEAVEIHFTQFQLDNGDSVRIYDGETHQLAYYELKEGLERIITSSTNQMVIEYTNNGIQGGSGIGFNLTFRETSKASIVDSLCGKNAFELDKGIYGWEIDETMVETSLVFTEFSLEEGTDFIKIYSGNDVYAESLLRIESGKDRVPLPFDIKNAPLYFQFIKQSENNVGFKLVCANNNTSAPTLPDLGNENSNLGIIIGSCVGILFIFGAAIFIYKRKKKENDIENLSLVAESKEHSKLSINENV